MSTTKINRPLSPHATIYRWPLNAIMSIMHRISGVGMILGGVIIVWVFTAATISEEYYQFTTAIITSTLVDLVLYGSLVAFWFHYFNGIRHLFWDVGLTFEEKNIQISAYLGLVGTILMSVISLLYILLA